MFSISRVGSLPSLLLLLALSGLCTVATSAESEQLLEKILAEIKALRNDQDKMKQELETLKKQASRPAQPPRESDLENAYLNLKSSPTLGNESTKLLMFEYSDYQCPYCARYASDVFPEINKKYIKTGKLRYIFRDFPLEQIHPKAKNAAEAAHCAGEQGRYWEMHDVLFANRSKLDQVRKFASDLQLDQAAFESCIESDKYADSIQQDVEEGRKIGVRGTPSFVLAIEDDKGEIKGIRLMRGAKSFDAFQSEIEKLLETQSN